jgi:cyclopropane fatty-acyl-phospholipid synthase-like methyltransferase
MNFSSLERIYPAEGSREVIAGNETLHLHLQRYHFAGKWVLPGTVADLACGSGYGSHLLATEYGKEITHIVAVDNSHVAIDYCKKFYSHEKIVYELMDVYAFRPTVPVNNIISLETIEHLPQPELFVNHAASMLAKGGRFIASAPITPSMDANPYHQSDFTIKSFKKLFKAAGLVEMESMVQVQQYKPSTMVLKKEDRGHDLRKGLVSYYLQNPGKFFKRLRSLITDGFTNKYLVAVFEKK